MRLRQEVNLEKFFKATIKQIEEPFHAHTTKERDGGLVMKTRKTPDEDEDE